MPVIWYDRYAVYLEQGENSHMVSVMDRYDQYKGTIPARLASWFFRGSRWFGEELVERKAKSLGELDQAR